MTGHANTPAGSGLRFAAPFARGTLRVPFSGRFRATPAHFRFTSGHFRSSGYSDTPTETTIGFVGPRNLLVPLLGSNGPLNPEKLSTSGRFPAISGPPLRVRISRTKFFFFSGQTTPRNTNFGRATPSQRNRRLMTDTQTDTQTDGISLRWSGLSGDDVSRGSLTRRVE